MRNNLKTKKKNLNCLVLVYKESIYGVEIFKVGFCNFFYGGIKGFCVFSLSMFSQIVTLCGVHLE